MIDGQVSDLRKQGFGLKVDLYQDRWANGRNALTCGFEDLGQIWADRFQSPDQDHGQIWVILGRPLTCDGQIWADLGDDLAMIHKAPPGSPPSEARGPGPVDGWGRERNDS